MLTFLGPLAKWLTDGTADWFWPAAEKAGLPVMFLAPGNGPAFLRIAERHPGLHLIVDHMNLSVDIARRLTERRMPECPGRPLVAVLGCERHGRLLDRGPEPRDALEVR